MFKNISLKTKVLIMVWVSIITISLLLGLTFVINLKSSYNEDIIQLKKETFDKQQEELKNYSYMAQKLIESYYNRTKKDKIVLEVKSKLKLQMDFLFNIIQAAYEKNKDIMTAQELQNHIVDVVKSSRYGKHGYFWINDKTPTMIMHPLKPALDGKNLSKSKDPNGVHLFNKMVEVVNEKENGFVQYSWSKPGSTKAVPKISYVKEFKEYGWIIGTGAYLEDLTAQMKEKALLALQSVRYNGKGYFWVNDMNYKILMHPIKPELAGMSFQNIKKFDFLTKGINRMIKESKNDILTEYKFFNPDTNKESEKISILTKFPPWDWVIGTGVYTDKINALIAKKEQDIKKKLDDLTMLILIVTIVMIVLSLFFINYISNKILIKPIEDLKEGLLNFFKYLNKETNKVEKIKITTQDEIGNMSTVINQNIEIIEKSFNKDSASIDELMSAVSKIKTGKLDILLEVKPASDNLKKVQTEFNSMIENLKNSVGYDINKIIDILNNYSNLEYEHQIPYPMGTIEKSINQLGQKLNLIKTENNNTSSLLNDKAIKLNDNVNNLKENSISQSELVQNSSNKLEEIIKNIQLQIDHSNLMASYSENISSSASSGSDLANDTTNAINNMSDMIKSITESLNTIDKIVVQTNILSLNASVEAVDAGDAGKGFMVVASEVRLLSENTQNAVKQIKQIVKEADVKSQEAKTIAGDMMGGYKKLLENISNTINLIQESSNISHSQQGSIEDIKEFMGKLENQTSKINVIVDEVKDISSDTNAVSKKLLELV